MTRTGPFQPRFRAFANSLGVHPSEVPTGAEGNIAFMAWIGASLLDYAETEDRPRTREAARRSRLSFAISAQCSSCHASESARSCSCFPANLCR